MVQQEFFNPEEKKQENISTVQRDVSGQLSARTEPDGHFDEYENIAEDETEFDERRGLECFSAHGEWGANHGADGRGRRLILAFGQVRVSRV